MLARAFFSMFENRPFNIPIAQRYALRVLLPTDLMGKHYAVRNQFDKVPVDRTYLIT
jgi:hypothetical protein